MSKETKQRKLNLEARLCKEFAYDELLGQMTRNGKPCGYKRKDGYVDIDVSIDGHVYRLKAHTVAWFLAYRQWPLGVIDHINGKRDDNAIGNLRDVSHRLNLHNIDTGTSGAWPTASGKWRSEIMKGARRICLGSWDTEAECRAAYITAKRLLHEGYLGR